MKSAKRGRNTSAAEVTNVSAHGFWILVNDRELFVPFTSFPWFREAPIAKLLHVEMPGADHLYWPDLDVDLSIASIEDPERFPLISGAAARRDPPRRPRSASRR